MAEIRTTISLLDNFSPVLAQLTSSLATAEGALGQFQNQFAAGVDLSSLSSANGDIQTLAATFSAVGGRMSDLGSNFNDLNDAINRIGDYASNAADNVSASQSVMADAAMLTADQMTGAAQSASSAAIAAAQAASDGVRNAMSAAGDSVQSNVGTAINATANNVANTVGNTANTVVNTTANAANSVSAAINNTATAAVNSANQSGEQIRASATNTATATAQSAQSASQTISSTLGNATANVQSNAKGASAALNAMGQSGKDAGAKAKDKLNEAANSAQSVANNAENARGRITDMGAAASRAATMGVGAMSGLAARVQDVTSNVSGLIAAYVSLQGLLKTFELSDASTNLTARLNIVNDGKQSVDELSDMIFSAAQRAGVSFNTMSEFVSRVGMTAKDAFSNNGEMIKFAEVLQKAFAISGTGSTEAGFAMLQISQSLASGVLQGDEFKSISENAAIVLEAVAKYMGKSRAEVKKLSSEGKITSQILKNALLSASDEINEKFSSMPNTFGTTWTMFVNTANRAFGKVLKRFEQLANSKQFAKVVTVASAALYKLADAVNWVIDKVVELYTYFTTNISKFTPIIYIVVGAFAIYATAVTIAKMAVIAHTAAMVAANTAMLLLNASMVAGKLALVAFAVCTMQVKKAWAMLNLVLAANPITIIILAVGALIALFYGVIEVINRVAGTSISATGIITSALFGVWATLKEIVAIAWNLILSFASFLANVFIHPIDAIKQLLWDLYDTFITIIAKLYAGFMWVGDKIKSLATDYSMSLSISNASPEQGLEMYKHWQEQKKKQPQSWDDYVKQAKDTLPTANDRSRRSPDLIDLKGEFGLDTANDISIYNAAAKGYDVGKNLTEEFSLDKLMDKVSDASQNVLNKFSPTGGGDTSLLGKIADNTGKTAKNTSKDKDDEFKFLREIGEREAVYNVHRNDIRLEVSNNNSISKEVDADSVIDRIIQSIMKSVGVMAEGIHQ